MEIKIIHFYPDLMSLYGSYANVSVLKRRLEQMGNTVTVKPILPGQEADLSSADFLYMGAGTEHAQKAALADFARYGETVKAAAESGVAMLFAGTAMELLGKTITDADGNVHDGIGLADFTAVQGSKRFVEDVYGHTDLYPEAVVGFMNKCSTISGVETPLLTELALVGLAVAVHPGTAGGSAGNGIYLQKESKSQVGSCYIGSADRRGDNRRT